MLLLTLMRNLTMISEDVGQRLTDRLPLQNRVNISNTYFSISAVPLSIALTHSVVEYIKCIDKSQLGQKRDMHELTVTFCSRLHIVASSWNEHRRLTLCPGGRGVFKTRVCFKTKSKFVHKSTRCRISFCFGEEEKKNVVTMLNWSYLWPSSR